MKPKYKTGTVVHYCENRQRLILGYNHETQTYDTIFLSGNHTQHGIVPLSKAYIEEFYEA